MPPRKNCPRKRTRKANSNSNKFYTNNVAYKEVFESCCQQVMRKQGKSTDSGREKVYR